MQVRITNLPANELEEFDLRRFRVGETYEVTQHLGMLLIVAGYAEISHTFARSEAADAPPRRRPPDSRNR